MLNGDEKETHTYMHAHTHTYTHTHTLTHRAYLTKLGPCRCY